MQAASIVSVGEVELKTYPFSDPDPVPPVAEKRLPYFRYDGSSARVNYDMRESLAADGSFGVGGAENCVVDPAEYGFSPDAAPKS